MCVCTVHEYQIDCYRTTCILCQIFALVKLYLTSPSFQDGHVTAECPASRVGSALEQLKRDPSYYPSFEERVGLDVTAVVCTVVQLYCMRQLRAAIPIDATLPMRVGTIKKLLKSGQLKLPL